MILLPLIQPFQLPVALALTAAAAAWGRGPERLAAMALAASPLLDIASCSIPGAQIVVETVQVSHVAADAIIFLALTLIAVEANRLYTLALGALHLLMLLAHLTGVIDQSVTPAADQLLRGGPPWLELVVLACGLALHRRRERRWGRYQSWRRSGQPPFTPPPQW